MNIEDIDISLIETNPTTHSNSTNDVEAEEQAIENMFRTINMDQVDRIINREDTVTLSSFNQNNHTTVIVTPHSASSPPLPHSPSDSESLSHSSQSSLVVSSVQPSTISSYNSSSSSSSSSAWDDNVEANSATTSSQPPEMTPEEKAEQEAREYQIASTMNIIHDVGNNHSSAANEARQAFASRSKLTSEFPPPLGKATIPGVKPASPIFLDNIVLTADMGARIAMRILASAARGEYNRSTFAAVILRQKSPRCAGLIFGSGKIVCTGTKKETDAELAIWIFHSIIECLLGIKLNVWNVRVENIVCDCALGYPIDLPRLKRTMPLPVNYDPEWFPGAHIFFHSLQTMGKVFSSGTVIVTGAQDMRLMPLTFQCVHRLLQNYCKDHLPSHRETLRAVSQYQSATSTATTRNIFEDSKKMIGLRDDSEASQQKDLDMLMNLVNDPSAAEPSGESPFDIPAGFLINNMSGLAQTLTAQHPSLLPPSASSSLLQNSKEPTLILPPPPPPMIPIPSTGSTAKHTEPNTRKPKQSLPTVSDEPTLIAYSGTHPSAKTTNQKQSKFKSSKPKTKTKPTNNTVATDTDKDQKKQRKKRWQQQNIQEDLINLIKLGRQHSKDNEATKKRKQPQEVTLHNKFAERSESISVFATRGFKQPKLTITPV